MIASMSRLLHQATIKGKAIKSNQFSEVGSDSYFAPFAFFAAILLFDCGFAARAIADNEVGWTDALANLAAKYPCRLLKKTQRQGAREIADRRRTSAVR